jgi:hypothetical protein
MKFIWRRTATQCDPWATALAFNPDDPLDYPRTMKRVKIALIASDGLCTLHIADLYEYDIMEQNFTTRIERQGK